MITDPVLFVDIDGVLNNTPLYERNKPRKGQTQPVDWLDPVCVARLGAVCDRTDAVVVVSSSWRNYLRPLHRLQHVLWLGGLAAPVLDCTAELDPPTAMKPDTRWREISLWLREHPGVTRWAIVDDLGWTGFPPERFVRTSIKTGITDADVESLVRVLRKE